MGTHYKSDLGLLHKQKRGQQFTLLNVLLKLRGGGDIYRGEDSSMDRSRRAQYSCAPVPQERTENNGPFVEGSKRRGKHYTMDDR